MHPNANRASNRFLSHTFNSQNLPANSNSISYSTNKGTLNLQIELRTMSNTKTLPNDDSHVEENTSTGGSVTESASTEEILEVDLEAFVSS